MIRPLCATSIVLSLCTSITGAQSSPIVVGAKNFTEQEILGHIVALAIERGTDLPVETRLGLGGTAICHAALVEGEIDVYVEYTGTALLNVLGEQVSSDSPLVFRSVARRYRDEFDVHWLAPLGFSNTYAITVRRDDAERFGWASVSDLRDHAPGMTGGFTSEFVERPDGLPGLRDAYGIALDGALDLEPGLMYEALTDGEVDVICAFSTDARIDVYDLVVLDDDRGFFPPYQASPVVRGEALRAHPEIRDALVALAGALTDEQMRALNYEVDVNRQDPRAVAAAWLDALSSGRTYQPMDASRQQAPFLVRRLGELTSKTIRHIVLTGLGVLLAVCIGVPLGVLAHRLRRLRGPMLALTEVVQTIPSLAMLAFLFAIYSVLGLLPAVTALVLYALLPIVLNTLTGLNETPHGAVEAARAVGMSEWQRLRMVELPLAIPMIIAGVRTATVLTVGIATLCTYIGAGGLGDFIARGLARNDTRLTLLGAVPAALLALALSGVVRLIESRLHPLRGQTQTSH